MPAGRDARRWLRLVAAGAGAALLATGASAALSATQSGAASSALAAYSASYGFNGHAGLYGYGMGFDPTDNTILVGDVWNYRVQRFSQAGNHIANIGKVAPRGGSGGMGAPFGVAGDPSGNVWVADQSNSRIVEWSHSGAYIRTIGSGGTPNYPPGCGGGSSLNPTNIVIDPATRDVFDSDVKCRTVYVYSSTGTYLRTFKWTSPTFAIPRGIGEDSAGNIYVAEFNTKKIYVFDQQGNELRSFASATHPTDMADVRGIAVDNVNHRVYAVGAENNKVVVFSTSGAYIATWSSAGSTAFNSIRYVATDQVGDVYVSDMFGYVVYKFNSSGTVLSWATPAQPPPDGGWNQLNGVAPDPVSGNLYGVDTFGNRLQVFKTAGGVSCPSKTSCPAFLFAFGQRGPLNPNTPNLDYPHVIAVDHNSNAVFIDGTNSVLRFTLDGSFVSGWGTHGRGIGQFSNGPQGMRLVPSGANAGTIYTTDVGTCRLQIYDYTGKLLSYMGSCGNSTDQMSGPRGLEVDPARNVVYVADAGHSRVVEWNLATKHIVATFNGPVNGVRLNQPRGVAIDPSGTWLYIGDSGNRRIVRVHASDLSASSAALVSTGADTPQGAFGGPEWMQFSGYDGLLYVSDNNMIIYAMKITG